MFTQVWDAWGSRTAGSSTFPGLLGRWLEHLGAGVLDWEEE